MLDDFFFVRRIAGLFDDERFDNFSPHGILFTDDLCRGNSRVHIQDQFQPLGIYIKTAGDNHAFLHAEQKDVALLIHAGEIARVQPARRKARSKAQGARFKEKSYRERSCHPQAWFETIPNAIKRKI